MTKRPLNVVFFVSRNKDNKDIPHFKPRDVAFVTREDIESGYLYDLFIDFVNNGVDGELSRMYYSVNYKDEDKIHKELLHFLIDNPTFDMCKIDSKLASIASKCSKSKRWLFDFDSTDKSKLSEFCSDLDIYVSDSIRISTTPNGYAIIVEQGFDMRKLLDKWKDIVTLKKDAAICVYWQRNEG